ncbi:MAG: hypothetical protein E6767_09860 [Dysgonomonas sp.]|nr:hypothetical protein [Dysgonomonas sp.]
MLIDIDSMNFREAVFLSENAYHNNQLNEYEFNNLIWYYAAICYEISNSENIEYTEKDKNIALSQCAVFMFMTDSLPMIKDDEIFIHPPFTYNQEDFAGQQDWSNTFVSTLMQAKKGNCHSLPYLYKIIMNELGYDSHLALAPNHIYIKAQNKKVGWYNIELTCGDFPTDAWLMASGYIHLDAIRNGIYMRALSEKESVAMTLVDLAQGYQAKFGIGDGSFMLMCCETSLKHFPNYINALLLKTEVLTALYKQASEAEQKDKFLTQMNETATLIHELGYRKMPSKMYSKWLGSLKGENSNQRMKAVIRKN